MNHNIYSAKEFADLRERINREMQRRGTYKWWNPLSTPKVGEDQSSPLTSPDDDNPIPVDDKTYTINTPSEGSIERTRNIEYPAHGDNPSTPNQDSGDQVNADEMRNLLVGLSKIKDINLFYGRDEIPNLAFRDPSGIQEVLEGAESDVRNIELKVGPNTDQYASKPDPNGGVQDQKNSEYPTDHNVRYPIENDQYVMPSGEYDGEEADEHTPLGPNNFYDDYGAKPGDSNYHPYNPYRSPKTKIIINGNIPVIHEVSNGTKLVKPITNGTTITVGGLDSTRFGPNPRNPQKGDPYPSVGTTIGVPGTCNVACTGLCYRTCDSMCSESCSTTCWARCGNACTASCGQSCTSCSSLCSDTCKTKCENSVGYSCVNSGAQTVMITPEGGKDGIPAKNTLTYNVYSCNGCSFSCQFYPNKKTDCWDAGCMGRCFISCNISCSQSCYGGCVDNKQSDGDDGYKGATSVGRGCSSGCTLNCIGTCSGVCEGICIQTCFAACKQLCSDNCTWTCSTNCGSGCAQGCTSGCGGCSSCSGSCIGEVYSRTCVGCGTKAGCTSACQHDCNSNCVGKGCRSICGIEAANACEANCRLSCTATSCTALCSDACSSQCTTCVNTCGAQCGACSSLCSTGCESACNINCTERCQHSCEDSCIHSCTETCGGCSDLCYSCTGMCIGVCSVKCESGCTSCSNNCSWWCDTSCSRNCMFDCDMYCIQTCTGSCATLLKSDTNTTTGPEREPTAEGYVYPHPKNRWEERESFKLFSSIDPYKEKVESDKLITITFDDKRNLLVIYRGLNGKFDGGNVWTGYIAKQTSIDGGVYNINHTTGEITINSEMLPGIVNSNQPNLDQGGGIFLVIIFYDKDNPIHDDDIETKLPFGFESLNPVHDKDGNIIVIIQRDEFLFPEEKEGGFKYGENN